MLKVKPLESISNKIKKFKSLKTTHLKPNQSYLLLLQEEHLFVFSPKHLLQSDLLSTWSRITFIYYQKENYQSQKQVQDYFYALTSKSGLFCSLLPKEFDLECLYLHIILFHTCYYFTKRPLLLVSCEQGEQVFARITQAIINCINSLE